MNKAQKGHFNKAGVSYKRYVREFRFEDAESYALAQEIKADIFAAGDKIDATAISKGKRIPGVLSRDMVSTEDPWLTVPSSTVMLVPMVPAPIRVRYSREKGMPGQMGHKKITIQNLEVVRVDAEKNLLLVKGAVPGPKKSLVTIKGNSKG